MFTAKHISRGLSPHGDSSFILIWRKKRELKPNKRFLQTTVLGSLKSNIRSRGASSHPQSSNDTKRRKSDSESDQSNRATNSKRTTADVSPKRNLKRELPAKRHDKKIYEPKTKETKSWAEWLLEIRRLEKKDMVTVYVSTNQRVHKILYMVCTCMY